MRKAPSLGRGLDALLGEMDRPSSIPETSIQLLPLSLIDQDSGQPRKLFLDEPLAELAQSIRTHGVLQPIIVRPDGPRYRIVAGERRFRACMLAELQEIPAVVHNLAPQEAMEVALVENLQRRDLNPMETANAIDSLLQEHSLTQEVLAERLGMSRSGLANSLRLLQLDEAGQTAVMTGHLSAGHARALLSAHQNHHKLLLQRVVAEGLSVRQLEKLVGAYKTPYAPPRRPAREPVEDFLPLVSAVRKQMGMKAEVTGTLDRGKITLSYSSRAALERFYQMMDLD